MWRVIQMNAMKTLLKLAAAVAAVAGIAYLVVKNIDTITEWLKNLCPCKAVPAAEEVPTEETPTEEPAAEEAAAAEQPAADASIPEGEPVAEESDFEA